MIDLDVKVIFPKNYDPASERGKHRLKRWRPARAIAVELAKAMRKRYLKQGKGPDSFGGYDSEGRKAISNRYPAFATPDHVREDGVLVFDSSRKFHAQTMRRVGSFNVSGGMWSGLSVRLSGKNRASIAFMGRSQGQSPEGQATVDGQKKAVYKPGGTKVSNSTKAITVFGSHAVNVLRNTTAEEAAMADAVNIASSREVAPSFGVEVLKTTGSRGNARLVRDMIRAIENKRVTL
jgi:hypothetical protein